MKKQMLKVYFYATETLSNGKEQTRLHAVYMSRTDETTGKLLTTEQQIERGTEALKAANYYNIRYGSTVDTIMIFA